MHIPDGYLSPQTALPVLAVMAPVWAVAVKRTKDRLNRKRVPVLSMCAAFTFVVMMFNIPVIGGSSAHAVGAVLVAILLGPWEACISVTVALLIQALAFGDGGIMAFGVNCLNMAVVMPFAGYGVYRLIAGHSKAGSARSMAGSFLGGYCGINLAALFAAAEFGIQPLLFKAADGVPMYCPYGFSQSIPAMMFAHGLFAGPLEGIVTAAAVTLIARFAPGLMTENIETEGAEAPKSFFKRYKVPIIALAVLVVLTPLGLIAKGTAFGEYSTHEIMNQIKYIPKGLAGFADWWQSLMPDYSLRGTSGGTASIAGYILSAVAGVVIISLVVFITSRLMIHFQKEKQD